MGVSPGSPAPSSVSQLQANSGASAWNVGDGGGAKRLGAGGGPRKGSGRVVPPAVGARSLEPWLMPLVTAPEGFLVEVEGAVLRAGHGRALGQRLDCLVLQTKALAVAFAQTPGRWVWR